MFRDHDQASRAIGLLLGGAGLSGLWGDAGPAPAVLLRYGDDLDLPAGKRALFLAAWSLWSPAAAGITLGEVVRDLDLASCSALCSLIVAYKGGPDAVEAWIVAQGGLVPAPAAALAGEGPIYGDWPTLDTLSLRYVGRVLARVNDNKTRAAELLGVDRRTVSRLAAAAREGQIPSMQTQRRRAARAAARRRDSSRRG